MKASYRSALLWAWMLIPCWCCAVSIARAEEAGADGSKAKEVVPADLGEWRITITLAGGAPGERISLFTWELSISSDGAAKFENLRDGGRKRVALFTGKLEKREVASVLRAATNAISDFKFTKEVSKNGDGWDVTLVLAAELRSIKVAYYDISLDSLRRTVPDITKIIELLNQRVTDPSQRIRIDRR
jgi:hypothetical protein